MRKIYKSMGAPYQWLVIAFVITSLLLAPAFSCFYPQAPIYSLCKHFDSLGLFVSIFGPTLLMPLFITLIVTHQLSKIFYPKDTVLVLGSHIASILTAVMSGILFIVAGATLTVPYLAVEFIQNSNLRFIIEILLVGLWMAPAGMLYLLALFMIQFGLLPKTLNQGFKPILMYILSGGLVAFVFGALAVIVYKLGLTGGNALNPNILPDTLEYIAEAPRSLLTLLLNPYISLLFSILAPIPMILIFKWWLTDRISKF